MPHQLAVTISWPNEYNRGAETYAPFSNESVREDWVEDCESAAEAGWVPLQGAQYLLHMVHPPFDPTKLVN